MTSFAARLNAHPDFRLHTGNINEYGALKMKGYKNSAEELLQCLKLQLHSWTPGDMDLKENRTILLAGTADTILGSHDRDDLKITLKVFMSRTDFEQICQCLHAVFDQLNIHFVEQLIVAFPKIETDLPASASDAEEAAAWLEVVKPIWTRIAELATDDHRHAVTLGVADLEVEQLRALYEWAPEDAKPSIDHYNIDGCCTVPPELQQYARDNDIQLLTHNDPRVFPTRESLQCICDDQDQCRLGMKDICSSFVPSWAARYTVMVRRRSIISAKGYLVQFEKEAK